MESLKSVNKPLQGSVDNRDVRLPVFNPYECALYHAVIAVIMTTCRWKERRPQQANRVQCGYGRMVFTFKKKCNTLSSGFKAPLVYIANTGF